jgi:hypothetical protein
MDQQHNGFDHEAESGEPEIDDSANPTDASPEHSDKSRSMSGREMLTQLQQMIDNVSYQAAPVIRDIGAKAAELAAVAGQKAGPLAYKAAEVTDQLGKKVAARSSDFAADLRRAAANDYPADAPASDQQESGSPETSQEAPDSGDSAPGA